MSVPPTPTKEFGNLEWITQEQNSKARSKGIFGILVPMGCATTLGILACGLYYFFIRDSKKQQILMRYRVVAQGATIGLTLIGLLNIYH